MSRFLWAMVVTVGLVGCGGAGEGDRQQGADTQQEAGEFQNATITRNPDNTFTLKAGDQTLSNISSFQVSDQEQESKDVKAFLAEPIAEDSGGGGKLCCTSCSLSGGVLICTGCVGC